MTDLFYRILEYGATWKKKKKNLISKLWLFNFPTGCATRLKKTPVKNFMQANLTIAEALKIY